MNILNKLLKRCCYQQQGDIWYKTIGFSLIIVKIQEDILRMAQVFMSNIGEEIQCWSSDTINIEDIVSISDIIGLEASVCRELMYFTVSEDKLEKLIPQLSFVQLYENGL